jgi:hypothetical protein
MTMGTGHLRGRVDFDGDTSLACSHARMSLAGIYAPSNRLSVYARWNPFHNPVRALVRVGLTRNWLAADKRA